MKAALPPVSRNVVAHVENHEIAGAALRIRRSGELVEDMCTGFSDIKLSAPVTERTIFRQASLTKLVTAVAVLQLVEDGQIALDDPVSRFIPSFGFTTAASELEPASMFPAAFYLEESERRRIENEFSHVSIVPASQRITIRDLLTHSSGLRHGLFSSTRVGRAYAAITLADRVDALSGVPGDFQPGTRTGYSPLVGFDILGRIVEIVTAADLQSLSDPGSSSPWEW